MMGIFEKKKDRQEEQKAEEVASQPSTPRTNGYVPVTNGHADGPANGPAHAQAS